MDLDVLGNINRILFQSVRRRRFIDDYYDSESDDSMDSYGDVEIFSDFTNAMQSGSKKSHASQDGEGETVSEPRKMMKLVDICAIKVAKCCQCHDLEMMEPALDEFLLKKVAFWAFPQDEGKVQTLARLCLPSENEWKRGVSSLNMNEIIEIRQVGFMVSAIIYKQSGETSRESTKVSITFEKQCITSTKCALCPEAVWCQHIISVILYRIRHADKIPIHAPVTETLSTLTRDQLQKLLQYAINEDPGGILGRVFQHIDDIKDKNSSLNNVMGAPDPTFGVGLDDKSTWDLTLEHMCINLTDDLKTGRRTYSENYNIKEKLQTSFSEQYIQRFYELLSKEENDAAGQVLIKLGLLAMEVMKTSRSYYTPRFLLYDLERLFSFFIMTYTGTIREQVIKSAVQINREASETSNVLYYSPCEYVDIRTIQLSTDLLNCEHQMETGEDSVGVLGAVSTAPFYQAVLTSFLPDPPKELQEILTDEEHILSSPYEEPIAVMLLRFDRLVQWDWVAKENGKVSHFDQIFNLGTVILKKMLSMSEKLSILGVEVDKSKEDADSRSSSPLFGQSSSTSKQDGGSNDTSGGQPLPTKRKSARKRKSKSEVTVAVKKAKTDGRRKFVDIKHQKVDGISVDQMACILLNVTFAIYSAAKEKPQKEKQENAVICQAKLRAVELGRFTAKASKSALSDTAYKWSYNMENMIKRSITYIPLDVKVQAVIPHTEGMRYVDAMLQTGLDFYRETLPLSLICLLLNICDMELKKKVEFCTLAICQTTKPLTDIVPEEAVYYHYGYSEGMKSRDQVLKKWKDILSIICDNATASPQAFSKMMAHIDTVKDMDFVAMAYGVVCCCTKRMNDEEKEQLLNIVLKCIIHAVKTPGWSGFASNKSRSYETLCLLGDELKTEFPKLILPAWKELCAYFKSAQLQGLIETIKSSVSESSGLTSDLSKMLLGYLQGKFDHAEDSIELLSILNDRPSFRQEAIKTILNNAKNYAPRALLLLTKLEHESHGQSKVKGEVFQKRVFQILLVAIARMNRAEYYHYHYQFSDAVDMTYLRYIYQQFTDHGTAEVAKGQQFCKFLEALDENCEVEPLLAFCDAMQTCKPLFEKVKQKLGATLGKKYYTQFDLRLKRCNHNEYNKILCEMMTARKHFSEYVPDGEEEFKVMLNNIRRDHKNKKKLQKLIIEYFLPQLHKDIVENSVPKF